MIPNSHHKIVIEEKVLLSKKTEKNGFFFNQDKQYLKSNHATQGIGYHVTIVLRDFPHFKFHPVYMKRENQAVYPHISGSYDANWKIKMAFAQVVESSHLVLLYKFL